MKHPIHFVLGAAVVLLGYELIGLAKGAVLDPLGDAGLLQRIAYHSAS